MQFTNTVQSTISGHDKLSENDNIHINDIL
jgi:hypothetical protein